MKKIFIFFAFFVSIAVSAQELSSLKVFINPGHGGYDSDDRNVVIHPFKQGDKEGFWESVANLDKGFFLRDYLQSRGATVFMSRTANTSADDLGLSTISAMANENNVDIFYSIHSNAHNAMVNYPLMLFKGYDNEPAKPEDKVIAQITGDNFFSQKIASWTINYANVRGDWSFYGGTSGLGVLRNLTVKGILSEGSFHDYIPETYRLMSPMYKKLEAWHFMKSIYDYFQVGEIATGNIAGDIRDSRNKITGVSYHINTGHDQYFPIHKAKVTLLPGSVTIETDTLYNGVYLFDELTPGNYQVKVEADGYYEATSNIVVEAHKTTYFNFEMNKIRSTPPVVLDYSPKVNLTTDSVACSSPIIIDFNWDMDEESMKQAFSITPHVDGELTFEDSQHRVVFTPSQPLDKSTLYTVKIDKSAKHPGDIALGEDFTFQFRTKSRNRLQLLASCPAQGDMHVYTKTNFRFVFDGVLTPSYVQDGIKVLDSDGNVLAKNLRTQSNNKVSAPYGSAYFDLSSDLIDGKEYKVVIDGGLVDNDGIVVYEPIEINFKAHNNLVTSKTIVDSFEESNTYAYDATGSSDVKSASASRSSTQKLFDSYAYSYTYSLSQNSGEAFYKAATPSVAVTPDNVMGLHIYGDFSQNNLFLVFEDESSQTYDVKLKTLDFVAWRFAEVELSALPAGKSFKFTGFKVKGTDNVLSASGTFYVDNLLLYDERVSIEENSSSADVKVYPNPVADYLTVEIPTAQSVLLELVSMNGVTVRTGSGNTLSVKGLPHGTYILRVILDSKQALSYPVIVSE